ncbi:MAG: hypothetical protein HC919_02555 [Oscillatoriales cyanobacterium SM2_2_1]|nr:hypothetical protein [Oscillatoriales cyanobacterium SM2_2_1]
MTWRGANTIWDRLGAGATYLLPMAAGAIFGGSLVTQFEFLVPLVFPFIQLAAGLSTAVIPPISLQFVVWFAIFLGVVRNPKLRHFLRFHAFQALLIDLAIALLGAVLTLFTRLFGELPFWTSLLDTIFTVIFLAAFALSFYSFYWIAQGKYAEIPVLSDVIYRQI